MQAVSRTFSKNNFLLKSYGRIPTEFGTKRNTFQLKRASMQFEIYQRVSHINEPSQLFCASSLIFILVQYFRKYFIEQFNPSFCLKPLILTVLVTPQTSVSDMDVEHQWSGCDNGPRKRGPRNSNELTPRYKKDLNHGRVHAWGVYSTFRSSTSKYSLEAPRPMSVRVPRESCKHGT